ncbi:MAG: 50S ribosomal protein L21 [Alphaproteobacteria bacterium]|nr:50S ribosomal protein L21 [Alphaproteobacteria bacterium]
MYAVIRTGGKQYRVAKDDVVEVEKLDGDAGATVAFNDVLLVAGTGETRIGAPYLAGASVTGEIVEQGRGDKVVIIKKRRRKGYHRKKGHRQHFTAVRITGINAA